MTITSMKCPQCHATIRLEEGLTQGYCEYCGHFYIVSQDARQEAPQSRSTFDEQNIHSHAMDTAHEVQRLIGPISELNKISFNKTSIKQSLKKVDEELKLVGAFDSFSMSAVGRLLPIIVFALFMILAIISVIGSKNIVVLGSASVSALFMAGLVKVLQIIAHKKNQDLVNQRDELTGRLEAANQRVRQINEDYDFDLIPQPYRNEEAMNFIYTAMIRQRAFTIAQAAHLYEDEMERRRMEEKYEQRIRDMEARYERQMKRQHEREMRTLETMDANTSNNNNSGAVLGSVIAAGAVLSAGAKIAKALRDMK